MRRKVTALLALTVGLSACMDGASDPMGDQDSVLAELTADENAVPPGYEPVDVDFDALLRELADGGGDDLLTSSEDLLPDAFSATLTPGESVVESKHAFLDGSPPKGDVLFSFDLTGSMGGVLNTAKANAGAIMAAVAGVIPDVNFGVTSYMDYPGFSAPAAQNCGYGSIYGGSTSVDYPYRMDRAMTGDFTSVGSAINGLTLGWGRDGPEAYARAIWESFNDGSIAWRAGAKRIVVNFADNIPHDCDLRTGWDPGRDAIVGTADDLDWDQVLTDMAAANVTLIEMHSYADSRWRNWARSTGGEMYVLNQSAAAAAQIAATIAAEVSTIDHFSLEVCEGDEAYDGWLTGLAPLAYTDLNNTGPNILPFDLTFTAPVDAAGGVHTFDVCGIGDGAEYGRQTVEITVIVTPPPTVAPIVTGTQGDNLWYVSDVDVDWDIQLFGGTIESQTGCDVTTVTSDTDGVTFACEVTTEGGTASASTTFKRDATAPSIAATLTPPAPDGANGWYVSAVTVDWSVDDAMSGLASSTGCDSSTTATDGEDYSFTCSATDLAGNSADATSDPFDLDGTDPTVTYDGNAGSYGLTDDVAITCIAADNLSGIDTADCDDISGPAWSFDLGTNSFAGTATDVAGNSGSGSTAFDVAVTEAGLCGLVELFVSHHGVANSLCVKLKAAAKSESKGRLNARDGSLSAFINEVNAQTGKKVPADKAPILIAAAEAWMAS